MQRHRSIRDHFAAELFAEPALEALLQLFIAQEEGVRLSMLTLSRQCSVSESTGLRWIARLEALGYCERIADHQDHRRSWIVMSDDGVPADAAVAGYATARGVRAVAFSRGGAG
ncbi:hypothetical protein MOP88_04710 [Sphingomonas sp. WKB10]|nr:hypothetical protein [Sphingomonas sp. WKB10]